MSLIFPWLILGDADDANNDVALEKANVGYIINCTDNLKIHFPEKYKYVHLPVEEDNTYNITKHFKEAYYFIDYVSSLQKDDKTPKLLVHCASGCSRGPTIIMSYLMKAKGWDLTKSYDFVKGMRPTVNPNLGFVAQLSMYEQKLFGLSTKFGLDIRIYQFNDQFNTILFKASAFARSNLDKVTDVEARAKIKAMVEIYREYFTESILEWKECKIDDLVVLEKINEMILNIKEGVLVCDGVLKQL